MIRVLPVVLLALSVLACTGVATESPAPTPDPVTVEPAPAPHGKSRGGKAGKGGKAGRGERMAKDPQAPIPATGTPDPLAGLDAAQICTSDTLKDKEDQHVGCTP